MHLPMMVGSTARMVGAVLLGTLPLLGCAVGPDFSKPNAVFAAQWRAAADARLAAHAPVEALWWKTFDDKTLDHLVEVAYHQNLPLQVAGLRIVEARARYGVTTGMLFPQQQELFANGQAVGLSRNDPNAAEIVHHYGLYQVGFDAAWELDFWGKYRRGVQAEAASLLATVADYHSAIVSLTAEVARTYVELRTNEVLVEQYEANARIEEEGLSIAQSRFKNGATSELDPTQAEVQLQSTRAAIPKLKTEVQKARNALSTLLGQPAGAIDQLLVGAHTIPKAPPRVAVGVPADMLRRRPDVRSAELNAAAQCARIGVAVAVLYPSLSLVGTVGLESTSTANGVKNPFSSNGLFYNAGVGIDWPFLNYGRVENSVRVEDARFQQLLVTYRDVVLRAAQEVEDAQTGFLNAQKAMTLEENAVAAAKRSVELAVVAYQEGATDFQRVLDAQRSLLQEQTNLTQTTASVATNLIALYKALGGGWELRQGQPVVPEPTQREMKKRTNWGDVLSQPRSPEHERSLPRD